MFLLAAACGPTAGDGGGGGGDDDGAPDGGRPDAAPPIVYPDGGSAQRCEKIDILFVIDNSGSMGEEQANLAANFPGFISVLDQSGLDYRVAVTSTGMDYSYTMDTPIGPLPSSQTGGDNGAMLQRCGMTRRWIEKTDTDPAGTFGCAAALGTSGPSDEMPLASMRAAFDDRMSDGTNGGFRRDDALLAVVLLTDENDCSYEQSVTLPFAQSLCDSMMEPVSNYVGYLDSYTGDRGRWAAAVIAGPGPGRCTSDFGDADYAQRLDDFVQQTGQNAVLSSICSGDLTTGLADALEVFSAACDEFPPID
ncbi:MAG: hypothetical protein H6709_15105 [Kofleriaceae bacterium]|nr:hypothetical protein [Kofleriaceae bacterium]MCB9573406.1 hypothetical protein [Kofleriaceae bacterium]